MVTYLKAKNKNKKVCFEKESNDNEEVSYPASIQGKTYKLYIRSSELQLYLIIIIQIH